MTTPIKYYQTDERWAYSSYSAKGESKTIKAAGCGITVASMVIASLADKTCTPLTTAKWSMAHGYKYLNQGTAYGYFVPQLKVYGIEAKMLNSSSLYGKSDSSAHRAAKEALKQGKWVIACMGPGNWTKAGHYILLYNYRNGYVDINDPASTASIREHNKWTLYASQVKYMWVVDTTPKKIYINEVAAATLKKGSKGAQVKLLQQNLNRLGCLVDADGIYGDKTAAALKIFQRRYGLTVDGIYGRKSASKMRLLIR